MDRLKGRIAVVTGGGQGIGRATAERLAEEGARVLVATRSEGPGRATVASIEAAGGEAALFLCDLGRRESSAMLVREAVDRFGGIDIIVHNAGLISSARLSDLSDEELDETLNLNLKAAFWLAADALPHLRRSEAARLLFTSSIIGNRQARAGYAAYGVSKVALNGFVRMAAVELAGEGIRVNCVEPGVTATERVLQTLPADRLAELRAAVPLGSAARPEDIAAAILFLASDDAAHITGQTIVVDGGQSLGSAGG